MSAILVQMIGGLEQIHELGPTNTLGRDAGNHIPVPDPLVSRHHAELQRTPEGRFRLVDLGSTHGTFVRGRKVAEFVLDHGDEFIIGSTKFRFENKSDRVSAQPDAATHQIASTDGVGFMVDAVDDAYVQQRVDAGTPQQFLPEEQLKNSDDLRRNYEKLRVAYELIRGIGTETDLDTILTRILQTIFDLLRADRAAILLMDPSGQAVPRMAKTREGKDEKIKLSRTVINEVVLNKHGILSADAGADARFDSAKSVVAGGIRSAMAVPMIYHGELVGVMHMDSLVASNMFTEKDLELFTSIAAQAALAIKNTMLNRRIQEEAKARVQFQRFLSPTVVDQVLKGELQIGQVGELRQITVLFADIRGFTRMSEGMSPGNVVALLNEYFDLMVEILFRHQGTFDKYVGDELMALFGVPVEQPYAPRLAVTCALEMKRLLAVFNTRRRAKGQPEVLVGFGIHTGDALCGTIGAKRAQQYTAIGDTINTGSRLCSLAKPHQILVSEQTASQLGSDFNVVELGETKVRGKTQEVRVFAVQSIAGVWDQDTSA